MNATAEMEKTTVAPALSQLDQLKQFTVVVADTGDFESLKEYAPRDATTNPSLILKAARKADYHFLVEKALADHQHSGLVGQALQDALIDYLLVLFGLEILKIVPGRVSTEVNATLSFDTAGTVAKARHLVSLYEKNGTPRERVLIKIASTWEGIRAARRLQKEGINCNMTLLFSLPQAVACAKAGARLISPFVGRILDWHKAKTGNDYPATDDPGVLSVKEIYTYYKKYGYPTEIMGASFRNTGEILELAGCDLLTISPALLAELKNAHTPVGLKLDVASAKQSHIPRLEVDEKRFRWLLNENAMATEKTAEGIRLFAADTLLLAELLAARL